VMAMTPKQFEAYLRRDGGCVHCGAVDTAVGHHRANRGFGGLKSLNRPSNYLAICSELNGLMESNAEFREKALQYGWKLERYKFPEQTPIYDFYKGDWFLIDNEWNKTPYRLFMA